MTTITAKHWLGEITMPRFLAAIIVGALFTGCVGVETPIRLKGNEHSLPSNYHLIDKRPINSRSTFRDHNVRYYGDDSMTPNAPQQLWQKLDETFKREQPTIKPVVELEQLDVVVTLPNSEDVFIGGPLVLVANRKYLRVDISGTVNTKKFSFGVYKKMFSAPNAQDIASAVDEATSGAVTEIINHVKRSGQ